MFFSSLGGAGLPSKEYATAAMGLYFGTDANDLASEQNRDRLQNAIALLLADEGRGGQALTGSSDSISKIRAFVLASPNRPESRTWAGLTRAADRWREERTREQEQEDFLRKVNQVGGCSHWNSLVAGAIIGPYIFQALTSEYDLLLEGQRQRHCVFQYAGYCAEHTTRIFTVFKEGRRVATTAVNYVHRRGWVDSETHGRRNSRVEPGMLEAVGTLCKIYQGAWREGGGHSAHMDWTAPVGPGSLDLRKDGAAYPQWLKAA